jgi:hypothetical protein
MKKLSFIKACRRRRAQKVVDTAALTFIKQDGHGLGLGHGKKEPTVILSAGSQFHNPALTLRQVIADSIKKTLSIRPVKSVNPKTIKADETKLSELEMKRIRVIRYMNKLKAEGISAPKTVLSIIRRGKPMTEAQADLALTLLLRRDATWIRYKKTGEVK